MRRQGRENLAGRAARKALVWLLCALVPAWPAGCRREEPAPPPQTVAVPGYDTARKSEAAVRAARRAYDGAPPVIGHPPFGMDCITCHTAAGMSVPGAGFAPPMPHEHTAGLSAVSRCQQCHVFKNTDDLFAESTFDGLTQDLRPGKRLYDGAPPVLPHDVFLRENCQACHAGPAAREEIRCTHPERTHCGQCHVPATAAGEFLREVALGEGRSVAP